MVVKYRKLFVKILMLVVMCSSLAGIWGFEAKASSTDIIAYVAIPKSTDVVVGEICRQANNTVGGVQILYIYTPSGVSAKESLAFNQTMYSKLSNKKKATFMETALRAVKDSSLGAVEKNSVYNFIANQDDATSRAVSYLVESTTPDFVKAMKIIRPFNGVIGTVMGVISVAVFLFLSIGILFDVFYIAIPGIHVILERGESNRRPFGVSREAWLTYREIVQDFKSENILWAYFKRRIPVVLVVAILLGYLISGKIYDVLTMFIN